MGGMSYMGGMVAWVAWWRVSRLARFKITANYCKLVQSGATLICVRIGGGISTMGRANEKLLTQRPRRQAERRGPSGEEWPRRRFA